MHEKSCSEENTRCGWTIIRSRDLGPSQQNPGKELESCQKRQRPFELRGHESWDGMKTTRFLDFTAQNHRTIWMCTVLQEKEIRTPRVLPQSPQTLSTQAWGKLPLPGFQRGRVLNSRVVWEGPACPPHRCLWQVTAANAAGQGEGPNTLPAPEFLRGTSLASSEPNLN